MSTDFHRNTTTDKGDTYVSSHAKAAPTGQTARQATGLGRIIRGAFATRGASLRAAGTSAPSSPANSSSSVAVRSSATDPAGQVRASRAKGKHGKDAGRVNGSAIGSTEDAARRRLAAARGGRGTLDRERASAKGTRVSHTTRSAKAPSHRTGTFATRGASAKGSGAPSLRLLAPLALALAALLALTAASASAALTRQLQSQITEADGTALSNPTGLAVDNKDNGYVADTATRTLDKFDSAVLA